MLLFLLSEIMIYFKAPFKLLLCTSEYGISIKIKALSALENIVWIFYESLSLMTEYLTKLRNST